MATDNLMENYGKAVSDIESIVRLITSNEVPPEPVCAGKTDFKCNVSKESYCAMVEKTKEYIREGDIFQAVVSRRFESPFEGSLINAYRVLRTTNPSPYMVYMDIDGLEIMCSSPEPCEAGRRKAVHVPGGGLQAQRGDGRGGQGAGGGPAYRRKGTLEHNMLVDLARTTWDGYQNSNGEVMDYMMIHRYSKIMHIASRVEGDIGRIRTPSTP
jgi:anthranilate synthase component 1